MTMTGAALRLKGERNKSVQQRRHPWVFSGAIDRLVGGAPAPGGIVDVQDAAGRFLARGYYNAHSAITVRLLTWDEGEAVDRAFWRHRLEAAIARRALLPAEEETDCYRLVFAESDDLPGLIVDRYGDWLVLQSLTLGVDRVKEDLAADLLDLLHPRGIYERSDADVRAQEGLPPATGLLLGEEPPAQVIVHEHGHAFAVDVRAGHKTGFYLDQRENRRRVARYCAGAEVLNVFAYTGAFGVYAAAAGARRVANLDASAEALRLAEENLRLNGQDPAQAESVEGDAFQVLRRMRDAGRQFDVVILDPPKFAYSRAQVEAACRGYKDINMLGMRLLRSGGTLCTFSCSGLVSEDLFQKVVYGASIDVGREGRIVERLAQGCDHPVLLTFPEGAYLKGFVVRIE